MIGLNSSTCIQVPLSLLRQGDFALCSFQSKQQYLLVYLDYMVGHSYTRNFTFCFRLRFATDHQLSQIKCHLGLPMTIPVKKEIWDKIAKPM